MQCRSPRKSEWVLTPGLKYESGIQHHHLTCSTKETVHRLRSERSFLKNLRWLRLGLELEFCVWRLAFGVCLKEVSSMKQQIHAPTFETIWCAPSRELSNIALKHISFEKDSGSRKRATSNRTIVPFSAIKYRSFILHISNLLIFVALISTFEIKFSIEFLKCWYGTDQNNKLLFIY